MLTAEKSVLKHLNRTFSEIYAIRNCFDCNEFHFDKDISKQINSNNR